MVTGICSSRTWRDKAAHVAVSDLQWPHHGAYTTTTTKSTNTERETMRMRREETRFCPTLRNVNAIGCQLT